MRGALPDLTRSDRFVDSVKDRIEESHISRAQDMQNQSVPKIGKRYHNASQRTKPVATRDVSVPVADSCSHSSSALLLRLPCRSAVDSHGKPVFAAIFSNQIDDGFN